MSTALNCCIEIDPMLMALSNQSSSSRITITHRIEKSNAHFQCVTICLFLRCADANLVFQMLELRVASIRDPTKVRFRNSASV